MQQGLPQECIIENISWKNDLKGRSKDSLEVTVLGERKRQKKRREKFFLLNIPRKKN